MYTQEDIDKIIICREAIDKHREFNQTRQEIVDSATSIREAKQSLSAAVSVNLSGGLKGGQIIQPDFSMFSSEPANRDEIKDALEEERTQSTLEMYYALEEQGFKGEFPQDSYSLFKAWHDSKVFEIYKDCCPLVGNCDWCGEDSLKNQNCIQSYGLTDCTSRVKGCGVDWGGWSASFIRYKEGMTEIINGKTVAVTPCPKGHGYYQDVDNYKDFPIDLFWE